ALMYLAHYTRPDIAFAVDLLARYSSMKSHWVGVKNIYIYLQGTKDLGLFYQKNQERTMVGYCNDGHLSDPHDVRSQTGFVFLHGGTAFSTCRKSVIDI
uniref:Reverse transcriptase Ty1/copia-type domain-containing protein n=1 Tax=Aegilops tauschii subsp. strangulata TaxID=200361 RepID=A0A453FXJ5_AEGTS